MREISSLLLRQLGHGGRGSSGGSSRGALLRLLPSCLVVRSAVADMFLDVGLESSRYGAGPRLLCRGVFIQVAEEHDGGFCR